MVKRQYRILQVCNNLGPLYYVAQTKKYLFWYDIFSNNKTFVGAFECSVYRSCVDINTAMDRIRKFHEENCQDLKETIITEFTEDYFKYDKRK